MGCCAWPVLAAVERFAAVLAWPKLLHELLVEHLVDDALRVASVVDASAAVDAMCLLVAAVAHFVRKNCRGFDNWYLVHMLLLLWPAWLRALAQKRPWPVHRKFCQGVLLGLCFYSSTSLRQCWHFPLAAKPRGRSSLPGFDQ